MAGMCLYQITNRANGKYYIGSAVDRHIRWKTHRHLLLNNKHYNSKLQRAWNKYGEVSFTFESVHDFSDDTTLTEMRLAEGLILIVVVGLPECYNLSTHSFGSFRRVEQSTLSRQKISDALRGRKSTPEQIERNRQAILKWNAERRAAGLPHYNKGHIMSAEQREQVRKNHTGRIHDQAFRDKVSKRWKGVPKSEEQKRKISESEKRTKGLG